MLDRISIGAERLRHFKKQPPHGPKIVLVTGGTGSRFLAMELLKHTYNSSHIINVSDSGRSTRQLRLLFDMQAIGDIRSRLIDLASTKMPGYQESTALLQHRLAQTGTDGKLDFEFLRIINGEHPLVAAIEQNLSPYNTFATIIKRNLQQFQEERLKAEQLTGRNFDLRNASIGNLFLTGAYLYYDRCLETAIYFYRQLANVRGDVIPATLETIHLAAELADGNSVVGQQVITNSPNGPPQKLWYLNKEDLGAAEVFPSINKNAERAIKEADLIVFSMGSFKTSILSTLQIMGMAEAIRQSSAPKVFIANPVEDAETPGMTVGSMAQEIVRVLSERDSQPGNATDYLQYVLATKHPAHSGLRLLPHEAIKIPRDIELITHALLERPDVPTYDPNVLAKLLFSFV